jgi:hypothetical protein
VDLGGGASFGLVASEAVALNANDTGFPHARE